MPVWVLGSPLATCEDEIDIVTNVRRTGRMINIGKTGGIDVRHFEGFWEVLDNLDFKLRRELSIEIFTIQHLLYLSKSDTDCLVVPWQKWLIFASAEPG
jgi:hypothetical protein